MAKKSSSVVVEGLGTAVGLLKDAIVPALRAGIKEQFSNVMDAVEDRLLRLQARLAKAFAAAALLFIAGCSLAVALLFYLHDVAHMQRYVIALCAAGLFALAALTLAYTNRR